MTTHQDPVCGMKVAGIRMHQLENITSLLSNK